MSWITDVLKKFNKQSEDSKEELQELSQEQEDKKEPFVADISLYEFENVNWTEFGTMLKQNKILPNSYIKEPAEIEVKIGKQGHPMVILTFNSATSSSVRKYMLLQDGAFQDINGVMDDGKNPELIRVWNNFKDEIKYRNFLNTNREEYFQKSAADRTIKIAERTKKTLEDLYNKEQLFLEKYKDAIFDGFHYQRLELEDGNYVRYGELPQFIILKKIEDGKYMDGEGVIPFTPRTLEFCILHMTNGQKIEDGKYPEDFEKKCRQLQAFSGYNSEDWDKVIKTGKNIVRNQYKTSIITNEDEREF